MKKMWGTRVLVCGHQNSGAPFVPDWYIGWCHKYKYKYTPSEGERIAKGPMILPRLRN